MKFVINGCQINRVIVMKLTSVSIIILFFLLIAGCSSQLSYYTSSADKSQYSRSILTEAKLLKWPEDVRYSFGVAVATDRKTSDSSLSSYALFVPSGSSAKEISDLKIAYASPMSEKELEYFAQELDKILRKWSNKSSSFEGMYYEFYSGPEDEIINSLDISAWYPSVKFEFQNTEKKLIGMLTLGPDSYKYKYTFDEMKELAALQMLIAEAIDEIRAREKLAD
jgi:hypothetical protein